MRKITLEQKRTVEAAEGIQVVMIPVQRRLNGAAILSKGLAAVFRRRALDLGVDLEGIVPPEPALLLGEDAEKLGSPHGIFFIPCVDLDTGCIRYDLLADAIRASEPGLNFLVPYWDEESKIGCEIALHGLPVRLVYSQAEAWRATPPRLEVSWDKPDSIFVTINPKVKLQMEAGEAFIAASSKAATIVTIARVSNITLIQAALKAAKRVVVIDPGLLAAWRSGTLALIDGSEIIRTTDNYAPGAVTAAVRAVIPTVNKAFGVEPPGLRSEAGLPGLINIWDRVKTLSQVTK